jgi:hypothetical protein
VALDLNFNNYLPHNESRSIILDPSATGIDDSGLSQPLDFISDLSIGCEKTDNPYFGSINIGKELITGIIMCSAEPILTFTALKTDWNYGKPIFLNQVKDGYSGYITPGRLNIVDKPIVHSYSTEAQSRIAERCLIRLASAVGAVIHSENRIRLTGDVTLEGINGLTLETQNDRIFFVLSDEQKKDCANGVNLVPEYHADLIHQVGCINGVCPDDRGYLKLVFKGPFELTPITDYVKIYDDSGNVVGEYEIPIGAHVGLDLATEDLCDKDEPKVFQPEVNAVTIFPPVELICVGQSGDCPEGYFWDGFRCIKEELPIEIYTEFVAPSGCDKATTVTIKISINNENIDADFLMALTNDLGLIVFFNNESIGQIKDVGPDVFVTTVDANVGLYNIIVTNGLSTSKIYANKVVRITPAINIQHKPGGLGCEPPSVLENKIRNHVGWPSIMSDIPMFAPSLDSSPTVPMFTVSAGLVTKTEPHILPYRYSNGPYYYALPYTVSLSITRTNLVHPVIWANVASSRTLWGLNIPVGETRRLRMLLPGIVNYYFIPGYGYSAVPSVTMPPGHGIGVANIEFQRAGCSIYVDTLLCVDPKDPTKVLDFRIQPSS